MLHAILGHVTGAGLAVWVRLEFAIFSCRWLRGSRRLLKTGPALGGLNPYPYDATQAV